MAHLIDKAAVVAEIERLYQEHSSKEYIDEAGCVLDKLEDFIDTLEVIDTYEQCIQYASLEAVIKAHAEDYSFNIESELFNQLTKEQQKLWRKEIEQACISGGYNGLDLARDPRYKENLEVKEVDLETEIENYLSSYWLNEKELHPFLGHMAKYFFELGLKAQKGEKV